MQYQLAFGFYVGNKPNGWTNLLLLTVCELIPVVGPIVALGYRAEVSERLLRDPELRRHPDFSFDRFTKYLERGLWPFLISLVASLVFIPVFALAWVAIPIAAAAGQPLVGVLVAMGLIFAGVLALTAVLIPITFHAEMANRFDLGGGFRFSLDFLKRVGGAATLTYLLFVPMAVAATFLGLLVCFVGVYAANALVQMAAQHLMTQLYVLYLERGGAEIEKTEPSRRRQRYEDEEDEEDDGGYDIEDRRRRE